SLPIFLNEYLLKSFLRVIRTGLLPLPTWLFVNNELVYSVWRDQGEFLTEKPINLKAGREYDIKLDFYQGGGNSVVRFSYGPDPRGEGKEAVAMAQKSDIAVVCLGFNALSEKEGTDRPYGLSVRQKNFLTAVKAKNPNTIVVLFGGGNADIDAWLNNARALIHAWYPGQEGGQALAEILFGLVNPSGKLPISIEKRWEDSPAYKSYYDDDEDRHVQYSEGVFVGYRHFDTENVAPLFPFGYGLSYTTYAYSNMRLSKTEVTGTELLEISVDVTNTGKVNGSEVVQLYVHDMEASLPRPDKELKAFAKVELKAGETKSVKLTLDKSAFSFFDPQKGRWVAEAGQFELRVGSSSGDIRLKKLVDYRE
ncbi:MAG TPA: glycoside hydrolase family 3 C-terminal domain-containing protein, partial [Bacteroidales bacterium]|nr:glycoside hydrolase family 3 C-terminal domain-containing protein [Bacteroidales bacterium]